MHSLAYLVAFELVLAPPLAHRAFAQVNPQILGTWQLDLSKSVYKLGPPPKAQTQTYEKSGDGLKVSVETLVASGVRIAYGYTANVDGKEYPMDGELTPNGAETIALRPVDAFTIEATLRRAGDIVLTTRIVISQDRRVLTLTSAGTSVHELPTDSVTVFDRR